MTLIEYLLVWIKCLVISNITSSLVSNMGSGGGGGFGRGEMVFLVSCVFNMVDNKESNFGFIRWFRLYAIFFNFY